MNDPSLMPYEENEPLHEQRMIPYDPLTGSSRSKSIYTFEYISRRRLLISLFTILPLYFFILPYVILPYPISYLANILGITGYEDFLLLYNLFYQIILLIITVVFFIPLLRQSVADLRRRGPRHFFVWWGLSYAAFYGVNIAAGILSSIVNGDYAISNNQQTIISLTGDNPAITAIIAVFLGPVVEELIFRGIIFRAIRPFGKIPACAVSALTFGLIHVLSAVISGNIHEILLIIPYLAMGLSLSVIYEKRRNILLPICVHMTQNAVSILLMLLLSSISLP